MLAAPRATAQNPIQNENANGSGVTSAWGDPGPSEAEGYASETSVEPGQNVNFHVSAPTGVGYRLDVYRIGWYGGVGGRRVATLSNVGVQRPIPSPAPGTGEVRAGWPVTDVLPTSVSWVTGYYLARIVLADGRAPGAIPFVLREPTLALPSAVVVQVPVNTWQAYNAWGGKSLYDFNSGGARANRVSFDRPYLWSGPGWQVMTSWELSLVRFLEREGVDVSYVTDVDVDRDPGVLLRHRVAVTAGHGEYWTKVIRDAYDDARAKSTNLLFMGANTGYWQVRYENARRTMVGYKDAFLDPEPNPALKTVRFRELQPSRPECALLGVQHYEGSYAWPRADFVTNPFPSGSQWFKNTGLAAGSLVSLVVSREHDLIPPGTNCGLPLQVLFHHDAVNDPLERSESVRYTFPGSGARVFASGSLEFPWALDDYRYPDGPGTPINPGIQQFVRNLLRNALRPAPPTSVTTTIVSGRTLRITIGRRGDPRVTKHKVYRRLGGAAPPLTDAGWKLICQPTTASCQNTVPAAGVYRFAAVAVDRWGESVTTFSGRRTVP